MKTPLSTIQQSAPLTPVPPSWWLGAPQVPTGGDQAPWTTVGELRIQKGELQGIEGEQPLLDMFRY